MKKMKSILAAVTSVAMLFTAMTSFSVFAETEKQTTEETVARLTPETRALLKEIASGGEIAEEQDGSGLRMVKVLTEEEKDIIFPYLTPNQRASLEKIYEETGEYRIGSVILNPSKIEATTEEQEETKETEEQETTENIPVQTDDPTCDCIDDINSELLFEHDGYTIPYSFEEFLAMSDEEFLALEDIPESANKYYKEMRNSEGGTLGGEIVFQFNDDIDFGQFDFDDTTKKEEICEFLNIPSEIISEIRYSESYSHWGKAYFIPAMEEEYNGYSAEYVTNKLEIYLHFHEAIFRTGFEWLLDASPCFAPGDLDQDGKIGVTDVITLQKWLLGSGELENWQSADIHEDGMINIYDLLLLKQMLIEQ